MCAPPWAPLTPHLPPTRVFVPTCGSAASACTIWSCKAAPTAARVWFLSGLAANVLIVMMSFHLAVAGSKHAVRCWAGVPWPQQRKTAVTGSAPRSWEEGAQQFRDDVAVNPADTEEAIWAFMCEARLWGAERARECFLQVCHTALGPARYFMVSPVVRASRARQPLLQGIGASRKAQSAAREHGQAVTVVAP